MFDKRWWLAISNGAFGGTILWAAICDMFTNNGNIVLKARPVAENYSASETLFLFLLIALFITNAIAWATED